ncbi:MAG: oligopeptide transporter, OPT family [Phycisphaeraceae bacterium]
MDASPALLGVGYILGVRIAGYMLSGAVLGWFVIIPAIGFFGAQASEPIFPATDKLIGAMSPDEIWSSYLRYIGAGAVIFGGLVSLIKSTPIIASSLWSVGSGVLSRSGRNADRTDRDLPLPLLALLLAGLGYAMFHFEEVRVGAAGAIAVLVFAFFFVTVSSRLAGLVGNSSNPASGMTIATLLGTALFFTYGLQMTGDDARFACISVGALVCVAICIAGDCSQDLKTGYLVRATPWKQQVGELIGVLTITIVIALVIQAVQGTYGFEKTPETPNPILAPQANIMKLLVEGVMGGSLPWALIISGMAAALVIELLGVPVLPVAVGLYLPLEISATIMAGALIRWGVEKWRRAAVQSEDSGILAASGLVAGQGLVNLAAVAAAVFIGGRYLNPLTNKDEPVVATHLMPYLSELTGLPQRYGYGEFGFNLFPLVPFGVLMLWLVFTAFRKPAPPVTVSASSALPLTEHTVDDEASIDLVDDDDEASEPGEGQARDTTLPFTPPPSDQEED